MKVELYGTTRYFFVSDFKGQNYKVVEVYDENSDSYEISIYYSDTDEEVTDEELVGEVLKAIQEGGDKK